MKKHILYSIYILLWTMSCNAPEQKNTPEVLKQVTLNNPVCNFIWQAMHDRYLWQNQVPLLSSTKQKDTNAYHTFLNQYVLEQELLKELRYQPGITDKNSTLITDYNAFNNALSMQNKSLGISYDIIINTDATVYAVVKYVFKHSKAAEKAIKRGDIFTKANGQTLTTSNYYDLLNQSSVTLGMAKYQNNQIKTLNKEITLNLELIKEKAIHTYSTLYLSGVKTGYILLNAFTKESIPELNAIFLEFKTNGVSELIIDLRYNTGGSLDSATTLASLITGQFTNNIFIKPQTTNTQNTTANAITFLDKTTDNEPLHSLKLDKVHIITSTLTAGTGEVLIHNLKPYIEVICIGAQTRGVYTALELLYDSKTYGMLDINPKHTKALLIPVYALADANGITLDNHGIIPTYYKNERPENMGILGTYTDPLLAKAIHVISGKNYTEKPFITPIEKRFSYENKKPYSKKIIIH